MCRFKSNQHGLNHIAVLCESKVVIRNTLGTVEVFTRKESFISAAVITNLISVETAFISALVTYQGVQAH